ncbi:MAG: transcription antitermination factor NusB [Actinomycetota bacterium]
MANIGKKPRPEPSRLLVFQFLTQVNRQGAYANLRLPELLAGSDLQERDRAFATELGYGTLRMQGKHDALIKNHIDRPFEEIDAGIIDLLRMGIHQISEMRVPNHAAVGETVEVARATIGESKASFVNAILRKASEDTEFLLRVEAIADPKLRLATLHSHPEWEVASFYDQLHDWDDVEALLRFNNIPVKPHLIAWSGRSDTSELIAEGGESLAWTSHGVLSAKAPGTYKAVRERRAGVQDRGSQLVAQIFLNTAKDEEQSLHWLDMCAGPGGKAAALFTDLAQNRPADRFTANEPSEHRARLVSQVIPDEKVISYQGQDLPNLGAMYDRILIDAPCTGLGALRRRAEARWRRTPQDLKELVKIQRELLSAGLEILNDGGILAYVTCSPHILETKAQILEILHRNKGFHLVDIHPYLPAEVPTRVLGDDGTLQLWTHRDDSDSMFMALLTRN